MATQRDPDKSRLIDALDEAQHCAEEAGRVKEDSASPRELYWFHQAQLVDHLLDALEALELGVQGRPTVEALEKAIAYYSLDVRLIVSILPPGAAMNRNR
jgi:hypothetical protein